jgi:flagellar hook protein FlgE
MSLFSTMNTGTAGLGVSTTWMNVIGDNIANLNTTGYKGGRASFADFMPQHVFGTAGGGQIGGGAATSQIATLFGQGSLESSGNALDMAIVGKGFFVVNDGDQSFYTRAGNFGFDDEGYVTNANGLRVQGYSGNGSGISAALGDLQIPTKGLAGTATSTVTLEANLSGDAEVGTDLAALDFYGTGAGSSSLVDAGDAADFTTSTTVYDSLGVGHDVTILFERSGANEWSWRAVGDASDVYDSTGTAFASDSGSAFELASGTLSFDSNGTLSAVTQTDTASSTSWNYLGSSTPQLSFDFGLDSGGEETDGSISMGGGASSLVAISQNGSMTGELASLTVTDDGTVVGSYTNGEQVDVGRVGIATFGGEGGLERVGNALFRAGPDAGDPAIGVANSGGRGSIAGNALEKSNVDLETEFVSMITAQRSYQANSKVISTANDTLQTLLQLI